MRDQLYERLRGEGIEITPQEYADSKTAVDRLLGGEIARYVFGPQQEFIRRIDQDPVLSRALALAEEARSTAELLARADAIAPTRSRPDLR
jgi:hypothetical protein